MALPMHLHPVATSSHEQMLMAIAENQSPAVIRSPCFQCICSPAKRAQAQMFKALVIARSRASTAELLNIDDRRLQVSPLVSCLLFI